MLRDDRPGRQPRARERLDRQGRPQPLARLAAAQPRRLDEPGGPPDGRRRGEDLGRTPPDLAVGLEDEGNEDPQQQADRRISSSGAASRRRFEETRCRVPSRRVRSWTTTSSKKVDGDERDAREEGRQDLVAPLDDHPRHGRPHDRRAQRAQVHPGLHRREHGRAQAGRVLRRRGCSRATAARRPPRRARPWLRALRARRRAAPGAPPAAAPAKA